MLIRTARGVVGPPPTTKELADGMYRMMLDCASWNAAINNTADDDEPWVPPTSPRVAPVVCDMINEMSISHTSDRPGDINCAETHNNDDNTSCPVLEQCNSSTDISPWMDDCTVAITGPRGSGTTRTMVDLLARRALLWKEQSRSCCTARNRQNFEKAILAQSPSMLEANTHSATNNSPHVNASVNTIDGNMPSKLYDYGVVLLDDGRAMHGSLNTQTMSQITASLRTLCQHFDIIDVGKHMKNNKPDKSHEYRRLLQHICSIYTHVATVCQHSPRVLWVFDSADMWEISDQSSSSFPTSQHTHESITRIIADTRMTFDSDHEPQYVDKDQLQQPPSDRGFWSRHWSMDLQDEKNAGNHMEVETETIDKIDTHFLLKNEVTAANFDSVSVIPPQNMVSLMRLRETNFPHVTLIVTTHQHNNPVLSQYSDTVIFCAAPFISRNYHQESHSLSRCRSTEKDILHDMLMKYAIWCICNKQPILQLHTNSNGGEIKTPTPIHITGILSNNDKVVDDDGIVVTAKRDIYIMAARWVSEWKTMIEACKKNPTQQLMVQPKIDVSTHSSSSSALSLWKAPILYNLHQQTVKQVVGSTLDISTL